MCSQEEIAQQRELLEIYRRTLAHHLRQIASLGAAFTPPYIVNGVYEARANIERIKIFLRSYAVPVEDLPTDKAQSGEQIPARIVPRQIPQVPDNYVERSGIEQELGA